MISTRVKYNFEIEYETNEYGNKYYYKIGTDIRHRLDGPAVEGKNGTKIWLQNNLYHRMDGPAIEWKSGYKEYYIRGKRIKFSGTDEEWMIKGLLE